MKILIERPPLWDEIDATFHVAGKPVIFAFGGIIFNPENAKVTKELVAHEEIHGRRQGPTAELCFAWWRRYMKDQGFRLQEEIPAHQAEYKAYCKRHGSGRQKALEHIASKLASPLYGNLISIPQAFRIIAEPVDWKVVAGQVVHPDSEAYKTFIKQSTQETINA